MANSDVAFTVILLASIPVACVFRWCPLKFRATVSACIGIAAILLACGPRDALHPLSAVSLSIACSKLVRPQWQPVVAFMLAFGHLGWLRLQARPPAGTTNALLLVLALRLASMPSKAPNGGGSEASHVEAPRQSLRMGSAEQVCYACCFVGLFTGPFFTHAAWDDAMRRPRPMPTRRALADGLLAAVGALIVWRGVATLLPYRHVVEMATAAGTSETFVSASFARRVLYFYASSFQFRWRFYVCWLLMDLAGRVVGFEPAAIANVRVADCELATSPSTFIAGWNLSVQSWLKSHIYRKLPQRTPRPVRMVATFAVSAFWHGVHPGYYLFFLGLFAMVGVEHLCLAAYGEGREKLSVSGTQTWLWARRAACFLWTHGCFAFYGGAFNLLDWRETFALWRALKYYGLWLTALPCIPALIRLGFAGRTKHAKADRHA